MIILTQILERIREDNACKGGSAVPAKCWINISSYSLVWLYKEEKWYFFLTSEQKPLEFCLFAFDDKC